jgi:chaperonin GroES
LITPLHDRVVVKRVEEEKKSAGGIFIPDSAVENTRTGKVLAVGSGKVNEQGVVFPMTVKVGDTVLLGKNAFVEIKVDGDNVLMMREDDILAVIESH